MAVRFVCRGKVNETRVARCQSTAWAIDEGNDMGAAGPEGLIAPAMGPNFVKMSLGFRLVICAAGRRLSFICAGGAPRCLNLPRATEG